MAFNPGGGGGIASATDIAFSSLQNNQTLIYNTASSKWLNDEDRQSVVVINAQTGVAYTPVLADMGALITTTSSSAVTITFPNNTTTSFPLGSRITVAQLGTGQVTLAGASGVTVSADPGLKIAARYGVAEAIKVATDQWLIVGRLAA